MRMLDDSRDPTPLLKEIRDDKVSTIIIDANASISHLVLRKVGPLLLFSIELKREQITSVVGSGLHRVCFAAPWSHDLGLSFFFVCGMQPSVGLTSLACDGGEPTVGKVLRVRLAQSRRQSHQQDSVVAMRLCLIKKSYCFNYV